MLVGKKNFQNLSVRLSSRKVENFWKLDTSSKSSCVSAYRKNLMKKCWHPLMAWMT
jgi:hypothetical protein